GNEVFVRKPTEDPRGLGVAGVLIRMFGLPSTLDLETQRKLDRRNELARERGRRNLSPEESEEFFELTSEIRALGLDYEARDPMYERYLKALWRYETDRVTSIEELPEEKQDEIVATIMRRLQEEA